MQTRCQLKGSLNLSSGICRNRAVSFLFCTTWQHSLGNFLLLGNFLFHHEIEHALCTCLVVLSQLQKNVSLTDRELSETDNRLTENRIPVLYFCMPLSRSNSRSDWLLGNTRTLDSRILSVLQWVCQTSVYPWVCSLAGKGSQTHAKPTILYTYSYSHAFCPLQY